MDYKLRLGNECDAYAEWGFQQTLWKDRSPVTNVPFGDARAMVSFGMSVETWF